MFICTRSSNFGLTVNRNFNANLGFTLTVPYFKLELLAIGLVAAILSISIGLSLVYVRYAKTSTSRNLIRISIFYHYSAKAFRRH